MGEVGVVDDKINRIGDDMTNGKYDACDTQEPVTMPFTGHGAEHLFATLNSITNSGLSVEIFDAFLAEYARSKDLDKARHFAMCEWDC